MGDAARAGPAVITEPVGEPWDGRSENLSTGCSDALVRALAQPEIEGDRAVLVEPGTCVHHG